MRDAIVFFYIAFLVTCCGTVRSQNHVQMNDDFNYYFAVLDSVLEGTKSKNQLTIDQSAFLYLINGWVESSATFDHYKGVSIESKNVLEWKLWYQRASTKIDPHEFYKAMEIYEEFFLQGTVDDDKLNYINGLEKKYRDI